MQADGGCLLLLVHFAVAFSSLLWKKVPLTLAFERNRLARFGNTSGFLRSEGAPAANGYWDFLVLVRFSDSVLPVRTLAFTHAWKESYRCEESCKEASGAHSSSIGPIEALGEVS